MSDRGLPPPAWLSRAEKREFRAVLEALPEGFSCSSGAKMDALADYVAARSRIAALRAMWRKASAKGYITDEKHAMSLARQIDATTALSHRIWKGLDLEGPAGEATETVGAVSG